MSGGEDYELLFIIKIEDFFKIKVNFNLIVIGYMIVEKEGIYLIIRVNMKIFIIVRGWNFLKEE